MLNATVKTVTGVAKGRHLMDNFIYYNVKDPAVKVEKMWYWKLDGKVIEAKTKREAEDCDRGGFKKLTDEEAARFQPGQYNPCYDMRGKSGEIMTPIDFPPQPIGDILQVIKI